MSGNLSSGSSGFRSGGALFGPVFLNASTPFRAIGPQASGGPAGQLFFVADVTEQEQHTDQLFITEHPIEAGSNISDHVYKRPSTVQIRLGWSNSNFLNYDPFYINGIYLGLLQFQADRTPFTLYTGKRVYNNMIFANMVVETDESSEWALRLEATFQQVFITNTQITTISTNANNQANPQSTLPTTSTGTQSPLPASNVNKSDYSEVFGPNAKLGNCQIIPLQSSSPTSVATPINGNTNPDIG